MDKIKFIRCMVPCEELLAQLAEEATELAHAALKMRRVSGVKNPTPVSFEVAYANLKEEIADVMLCLQTLGVAAEPGAYQEKIDAKLERWVNRLNATIKQN